MFRTKSSSHPTLNAGALAPSSPPMSQPSRPEIHLSLHFKLSSPVTAESKAMYGEILGRQQTNTIERNPLGCFMAAVIIKAETTLVQRYWTGRVRGHAKTSLETSIPWGLKYRQATVNSCEKRNFYLKFDLHLT
ncbi:hypothetical protein RRG08_051022 [Elysia crispata]|uniref:Uncharacterized protein n=1 Tax=Elysia crispata TaxID=231223 RepID=A0AAE1D9W8_9GAST|nr:hypothetical protein RRG08_051022 [Elysia crispata]